jgi:hypothetical protein
MSVRSPLPPVAWMASVAERFEPAGAFHPTVESPTTDFEFATVFRMPLVGVAVPIPTLAVRS